MSFHDSPSIDDNSKLSEESVVKSKEIFNRKNNFICREEMPDYGVDLDIELINKDQTASGHKFAIQIKSSSNPKIVEIDNQQYYCINILTSRIGYITRRKPGLGLIVFYDGKSQTLCFDYIEEIITTINQLKKNSNWLEQKTVTCYIPVKNILNQNSINEIYNKFQLRFRNHSLLLRTHADSFNLPNFIHPKEELSAKEVIENYGNFLVSQRKYREIVYWLEKLNRSQIVNSINFLTIAAFAYSEIGDIIEARYYLSKLNSMKEKLSGFELEIYYLLGPKIKFNSGDITLKQYRYEVEQIDKSNFTGLNKINLLGQLLQLESIEVFENNRYSIEFEEKLLNFYSIIKDEIKEKKTKIAFEIIHLETVVNYTEHLFNSILINQNLKLQLQQKINFDLEKVKITRYSRLNESCNNKINQILEFSEQTKDPLLKAETFLLKGKTFFNSEYQLFGAGLEKEKSNQVVNEYHKNFNFLIEAYNIFINNDRFLEAMLSLNIAIELKKLSTYMFKFIIPGAEIEQLKDLADQIKITKGLRNFQSGVDKMIKAKEESKNISISEKLLQYTDNEIEFLARKFLNIYELPKDCYENILFDLKINRDFIRLKENKRNLILIPKSDKLTNPWEYFKKKHVYKIKDEQTNFETPFSNNINELFSWINNRIGD